jgi:carbonic anhydrase
VVGHYGCGGVGAVLRKDRLGLIDNWLRHVKDVAFKHENALRSDVPFAARHDRLCELNAIEQALNVCGTSIVQDAWERGQKLAVHAWIYGLTDGHMHDLGLVVTGRDDMGDAYRRALEGMAERWRAAP